MHAMHGLPPVTAWHARELESSPPRRAGQSMLAAGVIGRAFRTFFFLSMAARDYSFPSSRQAEAPPPGRSGSGVSKLQM